MSNLWSRFQNNNKKQLFTVLAAGILAIATVVTTVSANGPTFNIFPIGYSGAQNTDYPLLDGRDTTKGEGWSTSDADHAAGVTANPGDTIEFLIYYHNGAADAPENTATSVVARATVPGSAGNTFAVSASISASNAATVNSSSKPRDVAVNISGSLPQTLTLVPGTTVWMPNRASSSVTMPDTITSGGVNLGDIQGCWNFSGFVKFQVRVSNNQPNYSMTINKLGRNDSTSGSYGDLTNADPGQTVQFQIVSTNTSSVAVDHVIVSDTLPARLSFIGGTMTSTKSPLSGDLFGGGIDIGTLQANESVTVTFKATVASSDQFPVGTTDLVNNSSTRSTQAQGPYSDTATVRVTKSAPQVCSVFVRATYDNSPWTGTLSYTINGPQSINDSTVPKDFSNITPGSYSAVRNSGGPSGAIYDGVSPASGNCPASGSLTFTYQFHHQTVNDMTLTKLGRNLTTGTVFAASTPAAPSQTVQFQIVVQNTGNGNITNVIVKDTLPSKLIFSSGTLTVDGVTATCQACVFDSLNGLNLGTMTASQTKTIVFNATVTGQNDFAVGTTTLTNNVSAYAAEVFQKVASADVVVTKTAPQKENGNPPSRI